MIITGDEFGKFEIFFLKKFGFELLIRFRIGFVFSLDFSVVCFCWWFVVCLSEVGEFFILVSIVFLILVLFLGNVFFWIKVLFLIKVLLLTGVWYKVIFCCVVFWVGDGIFGCIIFVDDGIVFIDCNEID